MSEAVAYSFIPKSHAEAFGGGDPSLSLSNPIASDMSDMRPSLLPSLLAAAQRNADRGIGDLAIFEVSHVYRGIAPRTNTALPPASVVAQPRSKIPAATGTGRSDCRRV